MRDLPVAQHPLPSFVFGKDSEKLQVLVYTFVHAFHIPQVEREVLGLRMTSSDLTLQEDECAGLRDDVAAKFRKQEVDHVDIALVDLWVVHFHLAFCRLCARLPGAEDVSKQLHDHRLSWRNDVL